MNIDLSPAVSRAQDVVNGLLVAIPSLAVGLLVFAAFALIGAGVKAAVARLTEARLRTHRNAGQAVGRLAQGLVIFVGLLVALSAALPSFQPGDVVQVLGRTSGPLKAPSPNAGAMGPLEGHMATPPTLPSVIEDEGEPKRSADRCSSTTG